MFINFDVRLDRNENEFAFQIWWEWDLTENREDCYCDVYIIPIAERDLFGQDMLCSLHQINAQLDGIIPADELQNYVMNHTDECVHRRCRLNLGETAHFRSTLPYRPARRENYIFVVYAIGKKTRKVIRIGSERIEMQFQVTKPQGIKASLHRLSDQLFHTNNYYRTLYIENPDGRWCVFEYERNGTPIRTVLSPEQCGRECILPDDVSEDTIRIYNLSSLLN